MTWSFTKRGHVAFCVNTASSDDMYNTSRLVLGQTNENWVQCLHLREVQHKSQVYRFFVFELVNSRLVGNPVPAMTDNATLSDYRNTEASLFGTC